MKTTRLISRIQTETASEDDSEIAVQLLSQLGVLFVEVDTSEDGVKEKRYTFVTDVDAQQTKQSKAGTAQDVIQPEPVPEAPAFTAASTAAEQEETDEDMADGLEQDDGSEKENTANHSDGQAPKTSCDLCHEELGSPVMLDFHKLRYCKVLKNLRIRRRAKRCPSCGRKFQHQMRLYNHLVEVHGTEVSEAMKILTELDTNEPDPVKKTVSTPEKKSDSSKSVGMETSPKVMKCEICEEYFQNRIQLRTHLIEEHDFSRQKAVSSVCEAVKLAQLQHQDEPVTKKVDPSGQFHCTECDSKFEEDQKLIHHMVSEHDVSLSKSEKTAHKQRLELIISKFACDLCPGKFSVRGRLSKHLAEVHKLDIKEIRSKVEKMYPRKSDAIFACDLCPVMCSKRYVLSRHLSAKHGLSKKQVRKKTDELYPLGDTKKVTSVLARSKGHSIKEGKAQDNHSERSPKSSLGRGVESTKPERTSQRLAMKGDSKNNDEEDEEVSEKTPSGRTEDEKIEDENRKHDKEELNGKVAQAAEEEAHDQDGVESVNDDIDIEDEEDIDDIDDDEEYVPSEVESEKKSVEGIRKTAEQSPRKRGRPRKILVDEDNLSPRPDGKEKAPAEDTTEATPRQRGRPRKIHRDQDAQKVTQKIPKKRGRPCWKPDPDGNYKCHKCDKTFQNLYYAKSHMNSKHKEQPAFSCSTCKKDFHFRNTFMRHLNCHKNEELGIKFTCELCGKVFFDKYNLGTHIKTHNAEKPYKCDFCDRGFFHKSLLVRHRNLHTKDVEYKCNVCDRVFYRKGGLRYHVLSYHENKKDFVCTVCGLGFPTRSSLTAHELTHSNSRPFQCDICGARVKTKGNLKEHMMCVHTDQRDFKCEICNKTFNRSHRLTLHLMMHRDERPHKCHLCDKGFRTRTNLRVHIKWHQDERDYQCEQCGKTFLIYGNLDRHMQTHKNGKVPRKRLARKTPPEDVKTDLQNAAAAQLPMVTDVVHTEDNQYQTVQNLVAGAGYESSLPTLASIAQHLSTMNIPVNFQVQNSNNQGAIPVTISGPIPVTINTNESTCAPLPGSVIPSGASMAIAAFGQVEGHQQLQNTPVTQAVQGEYDMELTI